MSRQSFFAGLLTGLTAGVLLMFANFSFFQSNQASSPPAAVVPRIVPITVRAEEMIPLPQRSVPKNWREFEFNGRSVYVIPLAQREELADR